MTILSRMDIAELSRRVENMIRFGSIEQIDFAAKRVRVRSGNVLTNWLQWRVGRAGRTKEWDPPDIGEQVMIFSPSGVIENGIVTPSIYCDDFDASSSDPNVHMREYPDGARISYNHSTGELIAHGVKTALVEASTQVTLDTPHVHLTGALEVDGPIIYHNGMTGVAGDADNSITINGNLIHTGGILSSNGIVLHTHTHPGTGGPL
ncbi:phage baseplate assembly protein V [Methylophilus sp. 3sh_L]|uniref:phage baseplate assembly protein V n=1 Tax=Methylophilus sp. 3sh_L TaxID=3377114 RepID=UPI00398E628F